MVSCKMTNQTMQAYGALLRMKTLLFSFYGHQLFAVACLFSVHIHK